MRRTEDILALVNFRCYLRHVKTLEIVDEREVHNVFTDNGRDWLAHLVAWYSLGDPDIPVTQRRVRWVGVGTGVTQLEAPSVEYIESPVPVDDAGNYLAALNSDPTTQFPVGAIPTVRFSREFAPTEISLDTNPTVPLTEAALFVDVHRVQDIGGNDDSPYAQGTPDELSTLLNPKLANNNPVAYARFDTVTKTQDFTFGISWDFRFGS